MSERCIERVHVIKANKFEAIAKNAFEREANHTKSLRNFLEVFSG